MSDFETYPSSSHFAPYTPPSHHRTQEPAILDSQYDSHHPNMSFEMSSSPMTVPQTLNKPTDMNNIYGTVGGHFVQPSKYSDAYMSQGLTPQSQYPTPPLQLPVNYRTYGENHMGHHQHMGMSMADMDSQYPAYDSAPMSKTGSFSSISSGSQMSPISPGGLPQHSNYPYHMSQNMMHNSRPASTPQGAPVNALLNSSPLSAGSWIPTAPHRDIYLGAQHSTNALHQIQGYTMNHDIRRTSSHLRDNGIEVNQVSRGRHRCREPGCTKAFKRAEHLKRHYSTSHNPNPSYQECPFCPNSRRFLASRIDNYRQHIRLHTVETKSAQSRVSYHPQAAALLREIESTMKRRTKTTRQD